MKDTLYKEPHRGGRFQCKDNPSTEDISPELHLTMRLVTDLSLRHMVITPVHMGSHFKLAQLGRNMRDSRVCMAASYRQQHEGLQGVHGS